jgi:hypothetical protein
MSRNVRHLSAGQRAEAEQAGRSANGRAGARNGYISASRRARSVPRPRPFRPGLRPSSGCARSVPGCVRSVSRAASVSRLRPFCPAGCLRSVPGCVRLLAGSVPSPRCARSVPRCARSVPAMRLYPGYIAAGLRQIGTGRDGPRQRRTGADTDRGTQTGAHTGQSTHRPEHTPAGDGTVPGMTMAPSIALARDILDTSEMDGAIDTSEGPAPGTAGDGMIAHTGTSPRRWPCTTGTCSAGVRGQGYCRRAALHGSDAEASAGADGSHDTFCRVADRDRWRHRHALACSMAPPARWYLERVPQIMPLTLRE